MSLPIIGITPAVEVKEGSAKIYKIQETYTDAIIRAGGSPLLLMPTEDTALLASYLDVCDGFLFSGGPDIDPALYGEAPRPACGAVSPDRDAFEMALLETLLKDGSGACPPVLGICRGVQVINVFFGGSLYQDIVTEYPVRVSHRQPVPCADTCHGVSIERDTPLFALCGAAPEVNSYHHQAVKRTGKGLAVAGYSQDGLVEALYHTTAPFLIAVQWHPERLPLPSAYALFDAFVATAKERKNAKEWERQK